MGGKVFHAGFSPSQLALPPLVTVGGAPAKSNVDLSGYLARLHNQGACESCVGETISEDMELTTDERAARLHHRQPKTWFSSSFPWDACNGGVDQGITYNCAFAYAANVGLAPYSFFPYDGCTALYSYASPSSAAYAAAAQHKLGNWYFLPVISEGQMIQTIKVELSAGIPVAIAAQWYDSLADKADSSLVNYQSGNFRYWHSTLMVGYNASGPLGVNSFGPYWGQNGYFRWGWGYLWYMLTHSMATMVVANPAHALPIMMVPTFPIGAWNGWARAARGRKAISPYDHGKHLRYEARLWWKHGQVLAARGVVSGPRYYAPKKKHGHGYVEMIFQRESLTFWPGTSWTSWTKHKLIA